MSLPASGDAWRTLLIGVMLGLVLLLLLLAVSTSQAGTYHVYSCTDPLTGKSLPTGNWKASGNGPTSNTCATEPIAGGLSVGAIPQFPATKATWTFTASPDTDIVRATLYRSATDSYRSLAYWAAPEDEYTSSNAFDSCQGSGQDAPCTLGNPSLSSCERLSCYPASDLLSTPAANLPSSQLSLSMRCLEAGCGGSEILHSADITLEQDFSPTGSAVGGSLTTQAVLQGIEDIRVSASDPGSGVFQAIFEIDGSVLARQTIDTNDGACQPYTTAPDGENVFLSAMPCPQSVTNVDIPFNTAQVSDGVHQLTVLVSDAAGNTTAILNRTAAFSNSGEYILQTQHQEQEHRLAQELATRGACNAGCDDHASLRSVRPKLSRKTITRRYADSSLTLAGQLVDHAGAPIAGAEIELRQQPSYVGAQSELVATTETGPSGNWQFHIAHGPSRLLTVGYRARSKDPTYATQLQYDERVLAPVVLSAPHRVSAGQPLDFHGRLTGGYISPGGVLVSLEIYYGDKWREIALLRTKRGGTFSYPYTFAAVEPTTYYFRASVPSATVYPFAPASSKTTHIRLLKG